MSLPSPELVNYYRLAENRIFYIDYEIDESVLEVQKAIIYYNIIDKDIPVSELKYQSFDLFLLKTLGSIVYLSNINFAISSICCL